MMFLLLNVESDALNINDKFHLICIAFFMGTPPPKGEGDRFHHSL